MRFYLTDDSGDIIIDGVIRMVQGTGSAPFVILNRNRFCCRGDLLSHSETGVVIGLDAVVLQSLISFRHAEGFP